MKKIAIGVVIVAVAIFAFLYVQLYRAQSLIKEHLNQQGVQVQAVNLSLFPPALSLSQVRTAAFSAQKIDAQLKAFPLFYGDAQLDGINIQQLTLSENARNASDVTLQFSPFSVKQLFAKKISLKGENRIYVRLNQPLYGKNKDFQFSFHQAHLDLATPKSMLIQFVDAALNRQPLGYIETHANFAQPTKQIVSYVKPQCDNDCLAVVKFQQANDQSAVNISGKYFPLKRLLTLLSFPDTLTGHTDFNLNLAFQRSELTQGRFNIHAQNGEIIGINLLDMVAKYFPINYNAELLQDKNLNTRFDQFHLQLFLQQNTLYAEKIELKTPALLGAGNGLVKLDLMQCDVNLNLRATDERYQKLTLPVHFFGDCYSPQYKFSLTKEFRHQLIDLIKEKLR